VELKGKLAQLQARVKTLGKVAVACSGGIDSSFLLKFSYDTLGSGKVLAVHAGTTLQTAEDAENLQAVVHAIGCRLLVLEFDPYAWPEFVANPPERCYLCKKKIYQGFLKEIRTQGFKKLIDGTNLDDLSDYRPGLAALKELAVKTPLAQAGLTKDEIRAAGRMIGLANWDRPSSSCLATRISPGLEINRRLIELVHSCESLLHGFGFFGCRVRIGEKAAFVELTEGDLERFAASPSYRTAMVEHLAIQGIEKVFLSLSERPGVYS